METGKKRVIALGFFDGVHIGHSALLTRAKKQAAALGALPSVLTFDTHPKRLLTGTAGVPLINALSDRAGLLRRLHGIENLLILPFNETLRQMPWADFLRLLQERHRAVHLVCGHDFQFGYRGEGNPERLLEKCRALGLGCDIIPEISLDGIPVSATHIRELLMAGEIAQANRFLGHPHILTETVLHGRKLGRKLGIPTINFHIPQEVLTPAHGVYATRVFLEDNSSHIAVTNIGCRPTLGEASPPTVESHILDFDEDLYGRQVRVEFHHFLRPERTFPHMAALRAQIQQDAEEARTYFQST